MDGLRDLENLVYTVIVRSESREGEPVNGINTTVIALAAARSPGTRDLTKAWVAESWTS